MSKRSKKDRSLPPAASPPDLLTPSTVLKVGETFIVLRRAPNKNGLTDERCLATIVEIRDGEQPSTSSASISAVDNTTTTATTLSSVNYLFLIHMDEYTIKEIIGEVELTQNTHYL
ncbi:unnamed protein product [Onchocerca flexuosa]|uniref:Uncharacterized protein n=1 Tax=Onchocerca flexuosa TaxID=387005 RepID=A0A183HW57_9BILA|nr:unnamed protein product [Onchocerca flexuosa]